MLKIKPVTIDGNARIPVLRGGRGVTDDNSARVPSTRSSRPNSDLNRSTLVRPTYTSKADEMVVGVSFKRVAAIVIGA
ncbi:MAG TPA: hypothetical protein VKP00_02765, partial [Gemmatimonadaceae bacterium]|nr:hypothetical protein [Gemmatimonadaceae bacterium]